MNIGYVVAIWKPNRPGFLKQSVSFLAVQLLGGRKKKKLESTVYGRLSNINTNCPNWKQRTILLQ